MAKAKKDIKKVVLAYSGGLDTTTIIPWLKENFDYGRTCQGLGAGIAGNGYWRRPYVYCTGQQNG